MVEETIKKISLLGQKALTYEVLLSPKPGLVDRDNSGSHKDMDIYTFMDSILSLSDYFYLSLREGCIFKEKDYSNLFKKIRPLGIEAEKQMYKSTKGINTHKGAVFIFGILCSSIGSLLANKEVLTIDGILERSKEISKDILDDFYGLENKENLTYGERQFLDYKILGIRGEAYSGFPSIKESYGAFVDNINKGYSEKVALGQSLIYLMENLDDSNIIGRKGRDGLEIVKDQARKIKALGGYTNSSGLKGILEADQVLISENISPGGCADLAGATLFLYWVIKDINNL